MARRTIRLPDNPDEQARLAQLNVPAFARRAVEAELDRHHRMAQLDTWLDQLDTTDGEPSPSAMANARAWLASATTLSGETS